MRIFLLGFLLAILIIGAVVYYFLHQLSFQPDWYDKTQAEALSGPLTTDVPAATETMKEKLQTQTRITLTEQQITPFMVAQLEKRTHLPLQPMIKAARTEITPAEIQLEMILDLDKMPRNQLPPEAHSALTTLIKILPDQAIHDLYVKCNLKPVKENTQVSFDPNSSIYIGKFRFPLADVEGRLGLPHGVPLRLLEFSDFELQENAIILVR